MKIKGLSVKCLLPCTDSQDVKIVWVHYVVIRDIYPLFYQILQLLILTATGKTAG